MEKRHYECFNNNILSPKYKILQILYSEKLNFGVSKCWCNVILELK